MTSLPHDEKPRRARGRPKRADAPIVPWDEVDRLLVLGEKVTNPETGVEAVKFPSLAALGERYGVSRNRVWQYASKANCLKRREEMRLKTQAAYERKVVERRAEARALGTEDVVRIVDGYITGFEQAVQEGKVRFDSPADLDRLVRLKELMLGNADSRQELQGGLTSMRSNSATIGCASRSTGSRRSCPARFRTTAGRWAMPRASTEMLPDCQFSRKAAVREVAATEIRGLGLADGVAVANADRRFPPSAPLALATIDPIARDADQPFVANRRAPSAPTGAALAGPGAALASGGVDATGANVARPARARPMWAWVGGGSIPRFSRPCRAFLLPSRTRAGWRNGRRCKCPEFQRRGSGSRPRGKWTRQPRLSREARARRGGCLRRWARRRWSWCRCSCAGRGAARGGCRAWSDRRPAGRNA